MRLNGIQNLGMILGMIGMTCLATSAVWAHCDTLDGPVVVAARQALAKGDVTPVLMWIQPVAETEIREAFQRALRVRSQGPEARELADRYFFETLVRVHRAGEGAPYTGLKAAGTDPGPFVSGADQALANGSVDALVTQLTEKLVAGVRERFADVSERQKHAAHTVEAGRLFVASYVEFVHYIERLGMDIVRSAGHEGTPAKDAHPSQTIAPVCHDH